MKKRLVLMIAMIFGVMMLAGCGKTVDLNKYVEIEVTGYDGYGEATIAWDDEALKADFKDVEFTDPNMKIFYSSPIGYVKDYCVDYELSEDKGLKNGDEIILEWDCDVIKAEEAASVKLKYSDIKVTVKDLKEIQEFDAFAFVELEYSGVAPKTSVNVKNIASPGDKAYNLSYSVDKNTGLKNGDTITVSVQNGKDVDYMIEMMGAVPKEASKTFKVEGLDSYAICLTDISEDMHKKMDAHARDLFTSNIAKNWDNPNDLHEIEFIGNYFLYPKDPFASWVSQNYIYYVYKITAYDHGTGDEFTYYWHCGFENIVILADGTVSVNINDADVLRDDVEFKHGGYYYVGYSTLDELFYKAVTQYVEAYTYEGTIR